MVDRVVRLLTSRQVFVCRRCGWRGWREKDRVVRRRLTPDDARDPRLAALDGDASKPD